MSETSISWLPPRPLKRRRKRRRSSGGKKNKCLCGCGLRRNPKRRFAPGHDGVSQRKTMIATPQPSPKIFCNRLHIERAQQGYRMCVAIVADRCSRFPKISARPMRSIAARNVLLFSRSRNSHGKGTAATSPATLRKHRQRQLRKEKHNENHQGCSTRHCKLQRVR